MLHVIGTVGICQLNFVEVLKCLRIRRRQRAGSTEGKSCIGNFQYCTLLSSTPDESWPRWCELSSLDIQAVRATHRNMSDSGSGDRDDVAEVLATTEQR